MRRVPVVDWLHRTLVDVGYYPDAEYRRLVNIDELNRHLAQMDGLITMCRTSRSVGPGIKAKLDRIHTALLAEREYLIPSRP